MEITRKKEIKQGFWGLGEGGKKYNDSTEEESNPGFFVFCPQEAEMCASLQQALNT